MKKSLQQAIIDAKSIVYSIKSNEFDNTSKYIEIDLTFDDDSVQVVKVAGLLLTECEIHFAGHVFTCSFDCLKTMLRTVIKNEAAITKFNNYLAIIRRYK